MATAARSEPTEREQREAQEAGELAGGKRQWKLPPEVEAALEQRRIEGQIVAAVASQTWGKSLTATMRRAVAQYCMRYGIDPLTELDMLGGNPYPNAEFYLRVLGELRLKGVVKDFWFDRISNDAELLKVAGDESAPGDDREWARREHWRRWRRRRELGAKEQATDACAFHIVLATGGHEIVGWKQAGGGTAVKQWSDRGAKPNPIVEDENNAALSVESQAVRRAVRQISSHVKGAAASPLLEIAKQFSAIETEAEALGEQIVATQPPEPEPAPEPKALNPASYNEADALVAQLEKKRDAEGRPVPVETTVQGAAPAPSLRRVHTPDDDPYREKLSPEMYAGVQDIVDRAQANHAAAVADLREKMATNPDMFGGETPIEQPKKHVCVECKRSVSGFSDHDPDCSHYADPD